MPFEIFEETLFYWPNVRRTLVDLCTYNIQECVRLHTEHCYYTISVGSSITEETYLWISIFR